MVLEQWHPVLHARMAAPIRDGQIDRVFRRRLTEQIAPTRAETRDCLLIEWHFRDRPQSQTLAAISTPLRGRIEYTDRFDRVAEQVKAYRVGFAGWENINDAATRGILARLHH